MRVIFLHIILALTLLTACTDSDVVYHNFETTPKEGWGKTDTLMMQTGEIQETGMYSVEMCVRITEAYPYQALTLMVEEVILPRNTRTVYPVTLQIATQEGKRNKEGLTYSEFINRLNTPYVRKGESIRFNIYHKMRRTALPGVTDVGMKVVKSYGKTTLGR